MAYLSKFFHKALIILLLFLYVMTFLIRVREECSVTNGVIRVSEGAAGRQHAGPDRGTRV